MRLHHFVIAITVLYSIVFSGIWSEPELIGYHSGMAELAVDNQGICWCNFSRFFYTYRNETSGWQFETEVTFAGHPCFDKGDTLWNLGWPGAFRMYYVRYDGASWSELEDVPTSPYFPEDLPWSPIILDSNGVVWVSWTSWEYTVLAYNRYKDGVWHGVEHIVGPGNYDSLRNLLAMTTDALGRVWVGWSTWSVDGDDTLEVSYYNGDAWVAAMPIGECFFYIYANLQLEPDRDGGMWAIWDKGYGLEDVYVLQTRYWDGEDWSSIDTLANSSGGYLPRIAVDTQNTVWAVWVQNQDIYYAFNIDTGWSEPAPIDENPAIEEWPDIAVDGAGRIWCVWASTRDDSSAIYASYTTGVGVEEPATHQPPRSTIESIYPNPFQSSTTISYSVANESQHVELSVFDVSGREVKTLASGEKTPGHYELIWNGKDNKGLRCSSGVYFVRMHSNEFNANQRVILLK